LVLRNNRRRHQELEDLGKSPDSPEVIRHSDQVKMFQNHIGPEMRLACTVVSVIS
jgi:hypothetical protein